MKKVRILVKNDEKNIQELEQANPSDAGYDIVATSDPIIVGKSLSKNGYVSIDYIEYQTNLQIQPHKGYHTLLMPRSSVSKYNLVLCNSVGLVDESYRGEIRARFKYIAQAEDMIISQVCDHKGYSFPLEIKINKEKIYKKGDKIAQLVISPTFEAEFVFVENLDETERGSGGFGSSGK